jgi:hypothetical protein
MKEGEKKSRNYYERRRRSREEKMKREKGEK